jgi:hypothetical protein
MTQLLALGIALVLLLGSFPLISAGTTAGFGPLWWFGLLVLVIGALIPPVARYTIDIEEDSTSAPQQQPEEDRP